MSGIGASTRIRMNTGLARGDSSPAQAALARGTRGARCQERNKRITQGCKVPPRGTRRPHLVLGFPACCCDPICVQGDHPLFVFHCSQPLGLAVPAGPDLKSL